MIFENAYHAYRIENPEFWKRCIPIGVKVGCIPIAETQIDT